MVDEQYYENSCPCCTDAKYSNDETISFDEDLLNDVLNEIYEERIDPKTGEYPVELQKATKRLFEKATDEGFDRSTDKKIRKRKNFLEKYDMSLEVFSAFRSHKYAEMMMSKLYDEKGNIKPFYKWVEETKDIQSHFNRNWLQTEYNTAILRAQQAADWQKFVSETDEFPRLTWMPTLSENPREEHKAFWSIGLTLPVNDPFWRRHHPGDRWNCKCHLEQTTKRSTPRKERPAESSAPKPADGLEGNPGITKAFVSPKHPYYPKPSNCPWLKQANKGVKNGLLGRWFASGCDNDCNTCLLMKARINNRTQSEIEESKKKFNSYNEDEWEKISFNEENGGYIVYSKTHQFSDYKAKGAKYSGGEAEKIVGEILLKRGKQVEFLPEQGNGAGVPDLKFDNHTWDVKNVETANENTIRKYYVDAKKAEYVIFFYTDDSKASIIRRAVTRENGNQKKNGTLKDMPKIVLIKY